MSETLREIGRGVVDLFFPPTCLTCGALAEPFCAACRAEIEPCDRLLQRDAVSGIRSIGYHEGPLRQAVLRMKFERKVALVGPLALMMAHEAAAQREWRPDLVTGTPIHPLRRLERGFNQAELLGRAISRELGLPYTETLRRLRATPHQVGRTAAERAVNLRGAFVHNPRAEITGKRVLLVDDVWTTGATLAECAAVLIEAGADEVFAVTATSDR